MNSKYFDTIDKLNFSDDILTLDLDWAVVRWSLSATMWHESQVLDNIDKCISYAVKVKTDWDAWHSSSNDFISCLESFEQDIAMVEWLRWWHHAWCT